MDPPAPTWCPQNGRRCPQPCWSWRCIGENTVQLDHDFWLLMSTYELFGYLCLLMSEKPGGSVNSPPGFSTNCAYQTYQTYITYKIFCKWHFYLFYLWFTYDLLMIHLWNGQGGVCLSYLGKIQLTYYTYDYLYYLLYLCYLSYLSHL